MSKKTETPAAVPDAASPTDELVDVAVLFDRLKVPAWQRAGLLVDQRWAKGKRVTETELRTALAAWLKKPLGR
jgi:hypothetical protein